MLSVHRSPHALQPYMPRRARSPPRVERGRSRDIPAQAIARRASEDRSFSNRRAALAIRLAPCTSDASPSPPRPPPVCNPPAPSRPPSRPVASSSSCRLPSFPPSCSSTRPSPMLVAPNRPSPSSPSPAQPSSFSDSRPQPAGACKPYTAPQAFVYESSIFYDDTPLPPRSLQDQMQEAYAADDMHLARVLYLKIQGIDVSGDDDPRIAQVKDEDFVFVPGGVLVLDDESLALLNEARERREKEEQAHKWRARELAWEAEAERARAAKALAQQRQKEKAERAPTLQAQRLELRTKGRLQPRGRPLFANPFVRPFSHTSSSQSSSSRSEHPTSSSLPPSRPVIGARLALQPSFRSRSRSRQDELLDSLLQAVEWQDNERRRVKGKGRDPEGSHSLPISHLRQAGDFSGSTCVACSAGSDLTISRTNSFASTASDATVSTCITTPSTSPNFDKPPLPPLGDDRAFEQLVVHSCRSSRTVRKSQLIPVPLADTPLSGRATLEQEQETARRSSAEKNPDTKSAALITRVRQSVSGLIDLASKMQQSYMRTIQFSVPLSLDVASLTLEPSGYRASALDVQRFAPRAACTPTRELNFPSEVNIPLNESHAARAGGGDAAAPARVFAPLAFVPPSPLRPRAAPAAPEWRLRPVANPCTLRLKALANLLGGRGVPWEGRAHSGSLGCGRERLTGVAFEGLGASRLAFEAK
ncbi:hypothetical protein DFH11DRAFT_1873288 [Phellopilus nigrolimitatus]|nr:hypothetical protein DFH11DRAFT_1873288 [Phellopilus nigrolimitatus]